MGRGKKCQPKQVVNLLRQIEVAIGKTTALACKDAGLSSGLDSTGVSSTAGCSFTTCSG